MKTKILIFILLSLSAPSALLSNGLPSTVYRLASPDPRLPSLTIFPTGPGPEDIVIDSLANPPRLLVSCASRRPEYAVYGEIESIDPNLNKRLIMKRSGEPTGMTFRPHGLSLVQSGEIQYLYVISHDDQRGEHRVIQYEVDGENLIFVQVFKSDLLVSPNALQAYPDGSLVVCNDAGTRNSMKEKIFGLKRGNILFYDRRGNWSIVAKKLGMPAGLSGIGNKIFVSAALENKLYSFQLIEGELTGKKEVCKIKGPDNIRVFNGSLLITSHSKPFKFIMHVKDKTRKSPSIVVSVNPRTGQSTRLFYDNGKQLSAASVAVFFQNRLVIGQIFEPFLGLADMQKD
ncbi:MAG: hypothetical protein WC699_07365 [Bacteroidales bacterium]|jgi:hypothetical protein